jgi:hypothetical protein
MAQPKQTFSFGFRNMTSPAPKWFLRLKRSITLLADTAAIMLLAWGYSSDSLIMLVVRVGVSGLLESFEALLSDPDRNQINSPAESTTH